MELNFWLSMSAKQGRNPRSGPQAVEPGFGYALYMISLSNQLEGKFETILRY